MPIDWNKYDTGPFHDELVETSGRPRGYAKELCKFIQNLSDVELQEYKAGADSAIKVMGITFRVYNDEEGSIDRAWPFDIVPRLIELKEWQQIEKGLKQRVKALNMFINDLYNEQNIVKDGIFPEALLTHSKNFLPQCKGVTPPLGIWAHICGSDLVRDQHGTVYVLEDNLRVPSGVSYMLENRQVMKRVFPEMFKQYDILPVDNYPSDLYDMLAALSPRNIPEPEIVVLTPGIYNSAYFEHAYLAQQMGAELVVGDDLVVEDDNCVYMRTINGLSRVDVIYRRIDDAFIDPEVFNPESTLGVPGLMRAWKSGNVALANAPGSGVADDKVVYSYVPQIIEYYLNETPLLSNVPTYRCVNPDEKEYVLANIEKMVVKPANESGGYGMLIGPHASAKEHEAFRQLIKDDPRNYVAQPMLLLSTAPTMVGNTVEGRHLDLRPFILSSQEVKVTMGGLTRVAMIKGSTVVNSSQGGGSKDTWIVDMEGS
ncbi:hypothetical protein FX988_03547 [Paraglaciecola mesophila]|uniref:Circularly permuted ATP-grasp type 2 domain-containing protein n=1 Tax=Paraglaciecola mesophila TaxID=197222 RepID=A0A857JP84_9ALTE|nr:circularly permuted type 2 ATP-grasp protein [Paraglaciecola mesophila]QHJ13286.1 hypothetical protein FX988_03547 [Paraglaciecola mesophila]